MNDHDMSGPDQLPSEAGSDPLSRESSRYRALTPHALSAVTDELVSRLNARLGPSATSLSRVAEPASDDEIDAFAAALIRPDAARSREMARWALSVGT